ncbi:hypothetical protein [Acidovorax sp. Root267]|uniref:hypothetical protein n=1 Tax=Acidovorax sp. Root267 TaxID=1736505 RepID=UPI0011251708|nr:hypothetical protein [Acidovorax sp. Root267]
MDSGPPFCVPIEVLEADIEKAKRELAEAEHEMRVMRGDCDDFKPMCKELGPTQPNVGDFSGMKNEHERQAEQFGFYDVFLDLEHWVALPDVLAREAAMLLCLHNPRKISFEDAKTTMRPDLPDWHLEHLDRRLSNYAALNPRPCRSLLGWYSAAQEMQIKLAPETVSFMEHVARRMESDSTPAAPVTNAKSKPRTWWDVSSAYIVEVMQAGQYATAKELYRALEAKAGPNGPFDKGTGPSRGSLFVREIAQPLSLKTVQNRWPALRKLAKN